MKVKFSDLERVAVKKEQYPEDNLVEFAFAGRSNVGKSSFINAMLSRKNLARTSQTPGKTRTINFYNINNEFRFVDLPGYGYAKVSKTERNSWSKIIETYLESREQLREVILIVDIRHTPTDQDLQMYNYILSNGFKGLVVATKLDKISKNKIKINIDNVMKKLNIYDKNLIIPSSSLIKGNPEIWKIFEGMLY